MRIRIVSRGSGLDTLILAVGDDGQEVPIHGVRRVEWAIDHPRGRAEAKLTVRADVDVEGELTEWRPQPRDPTIGSEGWEAEPSRGPRDDWLVGIILVIGMLAAAITVVLDKT